MCQKIPKQCLHLIGILCITFATIMLILVIVLPITLKRKMSNDFTQKCSPTMNNTNLWAKFPGELNSSLFHNYLIFDYKPPDDISKNFRIDVKSNISIQDL